MAKRVTLDGAGVGGEGISGEGLVASTGEISIEREIPAEVVLTFREFELAGTAFDAAAKQSWLAPLYSIGFCVENRERKRVYYVADGPNPDDAEPHVVTEPGYTELQWGEWTVRLYRDAHFDGQGLWISGSVKLEGPERSDAAEAQRRLAVIFDLLAPLSGVVGCPQLIHEWPSRRCLWQQGQGPTVQSPARLAYQEGGDLEVKPYLERALCLHDRLDDQAALALRALARTLTVPLVPVEPGILAVSTGIEILREYFWTGRGTYLPISRRRQVKEALRNFESEVPSDLRREYADALSAKVSEVCRRPFRCVADEVLEAHIPTALSRGSMSEFVKLRNTLIHKGVVEGWPEPGPITSQAHRRLAQAYMGLLRLWDDYMPPPPNL